jgi:hypothetical protein
LQRFFFTEDLQPDRDALAKDPLASRFAKQTTASGALFGGGSRGRLRKSVR